MRDPTGAPLALPEVPELERRRVRSQVWRELFGTNQPVKLGRFELRERIGAGAMGVVYSAHDPELDRSVALKAFDTTASGERGKHRILREARALARLSHPNVVAVHEVGSDGSTVFIAMELVEGLSLDRWLVASERTHRDVLAVLLDAGRAIAAAHERGIVHRDVKPSNIVVDAAGHACVVDFGLAHVERIDGPSSASSSLRTDLTETRAFIGTPAYASPEQLMGGAADAQSDQFSFAATAWEVLWKAPPFAGDTLESRLDSIRNGELRDRARSPALARALSFEPARRYRSMHELMSALERERRPARRKRLRWIAAATLSISAALAVWRLGRDRPAPSDPAVSNPLLRPDSVLACPILASGSETWLGAAAASLACRRARWMLGGRQPRILVPAELLALPRQPVDALPVDPFGQADARDKSLAAARARAAAVINGNVTRGHDGFAVVLRLETPDAREIGSSTGSARSLIEAVRAAMRSLESTNAIAARELDADVRRWTGVRTAEAGALLAELGPALDAAPDPKAVCDDVEAHSAELGMAIHRARVECDEIAGSTRGGPPAIDETSPEALVATAVPSVRSLAAQPDARAVEGAKRLAARLADLGRNESSSIGKQMLGWARAEVLHAAREDEAASTQVLQVFESMPSLWRLHNLALLVAASRSNAALLSRANVAWIPESAHAWTIAAGTVTLPCAGKAFERCPVAPQRLEFAQRAHGLAPDAPLYSMHLALRQLERDRVEDARALAAQISGTREDAEIARAYILGLADAKEGWLGRGFRRMRETLGRIEDLSWGRGGLSLLIQATRLAEVVNERRALGVEVAQRFVLSKPPRLPSAWQVDVPVIAACVHADRSIAMACVQRMRELRSQGGRWRHGLEGTEEFVRGAEAFARGELRAAAKIWRRVATTGYFSVFVPVEAFDVAGDTALAHSLDAPFLQAGQAYAGAHPAWVREARRARHQHERALARRWAKAVIDAWGDADVPLPAVSEMQSLMRMP